MKKLILAAIVAYVFLMATNYLVHSVWLMPDYNAIPQSHRSAGSIARHMWAMLLGQLFFAAMFAYIYSRGVERKPWLAQGIRYGVVMTCMTVIPSSLGEYTVYIIPYALAIKWLIAGAIQLLLLGVIVAGIYKEETAAA